MAVEREVAGAGVSSRLKVRGKGLLPLPKAAGEQSPFEAGSMEGR
jgi:hypothetical protein